MAKNDEVENLRSILSHVHERRDSFVRRAVRRLMAGFGARIQKRAIVERIETTSRKHAA
jgi:hypothetical protein